MITILKAPCPDGGDWEYVTYLIKKYGAVPQDIMPETNSSGKTGAMNKVLNNKLRADAVKLREMSKDGKSIEELRTQKKKTLAAVYKILVLNLGKPTKEFKWRYEYKDSEDKDRDGNNHEKNADDDKDLAVSESRSYTPKSFYAEFVGVDLDEYVDIFNDPAKKLGKLYRGRMTKNAYDNEDMTYANVDIGTIKSIVQKSILDDEPVWFGADVGKQQNREHGIMAMGLYDYDSIYNIDIQMTKAQRRLYHQTSRNHAMLFVGIDVVEGQTVKWQVENSWGDEKGSEGYWALYDEWFDEYVFNVIVHKKYVPADVLKIYEQKPIIIEPWDSMLLGR
jgi:bleomycin hydrolase